MKEETKEKILEALPQWMLTLRYRYFDIRMWVRHYSQKVFRKSHVSDYDCWGLDDALAKVILRYLKEFKKYPRHGYPAQFVDYSEEDGYCTSMTEEEYKKTHVGGGFDKWDEVLDEMIYTFEYVLADTDTWEKDSQWFYTKYNITKNEYVKNVESVICNEVFSYEAFKKEKREELYERYQRGMEYFAKYFMNLWD